MLHSPGRLPSSEWFHPSQLGKAYWIICLPFATKKCVCSDHKFAWGKTNYPSSAWFALYIFHVCRLALRVWDWGWFEDLEKKDESINYLNNHKGFCRTASATLCLLLIFYQVSKNMSIVYTIIEAALPFRCNSTKKKKKTLQQTRHNF